MTRHGGHRHAAHSTRPSEGQPSDALPSDGLPSDPHPPDSGEPAELAADRRAERFVTYKGVAAAALTALVLWVRQRYLL